MTDTASTSLTGRRVLLFCAAIAVNIFTGYLVQNVFELPLFMDSVGTVLVGALLGPVAGALAGATSNIVWGLILGNTAIMPFAITAAVIGWVAGYAVENGAFRNLGWAIITGLLVGALAALVSAPISTYVVTGVTGSGMDHLVSYFEQTSQNLLQAATIAGFIADPLDKMISFTIAYFLWKLLLPYFPREISTSRGLRGVSSYDAAVILGLLATVVCWIFLPAFGRSVFNIFYIVVLVSAWYGGLRGGLAAMFIGLLANILLLHPPFTDLGFHIEDALQLAVFLSVSLFITFISETRETALRDLRTLYDSLQKSEGQLRAITEGVVEALVLVSPDKVVTGVNAHFRDLVSLPEGKVVGQHVEALQPRLVQIFDEPESLMARIAQARDDGETFVDEVAQVWPVNSELELFSTPVSSENNEDLGRLFVFRDVTREREADRMKSQFLSMVSHELRTPLTSIKGFTEMILDGDTGEVNQEQTEFLEIVNNNADRLLGLVNDLLDTSRMESGRIDLTLGPVDVPSLVHDVSMTMQHLIDDKQQTLTLEIADDLPPVLGDRNRLIQVLTNLVSNAYKYSPEGSDISICATGDGGFVRLAVIDNGYGISEEDQKQLFTRFYRVNNSITREIGGTGLGLNIVKQIVEKHDGEIAVESVAGGGSTFAFTVPTTKRAVENEYEYDDEYGDSDVDLGVQSILVIEDEVDIALLVRRNLEKAGYFVVTAGSAEEALTLIEADIVTPDLITLDIALPGMDGFAFAGQLAENPETRDIPVLVLSVFADDPRGRQLGLTHAVPKPIDRAELLETVSDMLANAVQQRVLIVDEDPQVVETLLGVLGGHGIAATVAHDGATALAMAQSDPPSMILLDLELPDMAGFDLLRALKGKPETMDIPVIAMTGGSGLSMGERARALALGAADLVSRPFDAQTLVDEIDVLLNQEDV